jgi:hypothetical protein
MVGLLVPPSAKGSQRLPLLPSQNPVTRFFSFRIRYLHRFACSAGSTMEIGKECAPAATSRYRRPAGAGSARTPPCQTNLVPISDTWRCLQSPRNLFSQTNPISLVTGRKQNSYLVPDEPNSARGQAARRPDPFTACGRSPQPAAAVSRRYCTAGCDRL